MKSVAPDNAPSDDQQVDDNYQFTAKGHSPHLNCFTCARLMVKAKRMHPCAHTLCHRCMEDVQGFKKSAKICPLCLESIKAIQTDYLVGQLVGELEVKCLNDGCVWKGELQNYKKFHSKKCALKEGGIGKWLDQLKSSVTGMGLAKAKLQKKQFYDQNGVPIEHFVHQRQEMEPSEYQGQKGVVQKSFKREGTLSFQQPLVSDQQ